MPLFALDYYFKLIVAGGAWFRVPVNLNFYQHFGEQEQQIDHLDFIILIIDFIVE